MSEEHECNFVEEQEPSGRHILGPCLECGYKAADALAQLRTRVAELEKALSDGILGIEYWKQQAEHFTARCAEQGSKISELEVATTGGHFVGLKWACHVCGQWFDDVVERVKHLESHKKDKVELDELKNRPSTLEHELSVGESVIAQMTQDNVRMDKQLSTLLKASEGMAECLVNVQIDLEDMIKDRHTEGVLADVIKTLADFRAVKETMEKGAWK